MSGFRRMLFASQSGGGGLLPPGYIQTEYTEFSSANFVSTGIKTTNQSQIEAGVLSMDTTNGYLWRSDGSSSLTTNTAAYHSTSGTFRFGNKSADISGSLVRGSTLHDVVQKSSGVWIDNEKKGSYSGVSAFTSTNNLSFGTTTAGVRRFSYFRHIKNGVVVSDYISCKRESDGQAGMFDLVTRTFINGNTAGPVLTT